MQGIYDFYDPVPPGICFMNDLWIYVPTFSPRCIFQEQPRQRSCRPGTHLPMVIPPRGPKVWKNAAGIWLKPILFHTNLA